MKRKERLFAVLLAFVLMITTVIQPISAYAQNPSAETTSIIQETTTEATAKEKETTQKSTETTTAEEKTTQEAKESSTAEEKTTQEAKESSTAEEASTKKETAQEEKTTELKQETEPSKATTEEEASTKAEDTTETKKAEVEKYNEPAVQSEEGETKTITGAAWKTEPGQKVIYSGFDEYFSASGGVITLTYSDGTTEDVWYANCTDVIHWYDPQYQEPEIDENGNWLVGQKISVSVPIEGLEQNKWPTFVVEIKAAEEMDTGLSVDKELSLNLTAYTPVYLSYVAEKTGLYVLCGGYGQGFVNVYKNGQSIESEQWVNLDSTGVTTDEMIYICPIYFEQGETYVVKIRPDSTCESVISLIPETISGVKLSNEPYMTEYAYGYENDFSLYGCEIQIDFEHLGEKTYYRDEHHDMIDWKTATESIPKEDGKLQLGEHTVKIPIKTVKETDYPSFTVAVKDVSDIAVELTDKEQEYRIISGEKYFKYTPTEDGEYGIYVNNSAFMYVYENDVSIDSISFDYDDQVTACRLIHMKKGKEYIFNVHAYGTITLAVKKEVITSAKVTKKPDKLTYLSGYDEDIYSGGAEVTLIFQSGQKIVYGFWEGLEYINWNFIYQGEYVDSWSKKMKSGNQKVAVEIYGLDETEWPSFEISVIDEEGIEDSLTSEEVSYEFQREGQYLKYIPEEDGYYSLFADESGSYLLCSKQVILESKSWENHTSCEAVDTVWLEQGEIYLFCISASPDKILKLALKKDTLKKAEITKEPQKKEYISKIDDYISWDGIEFTLTFQYSGKKTYEERYNNIWSTYPIYLNPICDGLKSPWGSDDYYGEAYLASGTWEVYYAVKGLDKTDYPHYTIRVYSPSDIKDTLTEEAEQYEVGTGKYYLFRPKETGYYGLQTTQNGSLDLYQDTKRIGSKQWNASEDEEIKSLMWLDKEYPYLFKLSGPESMSLAVIPVTVKSGTLRTRETLEWKDLQYNGQVDYLRYDDETELKLNLDDGSTYLIDEDWDFCQVKLTAETLAGKYSHSLIPASGQNRIIADCHLDTNPSNEVQITSVADYAKKTLNVGEEITFSNQSDEYDYRYYKLTVNESGWYRFFGSNLEGIVLYESTNERLITGSVEGNNLEESIIWHLEKNKVYVVSCYLSEWSPFPEAKLLVSKAEAKDIKITNYRKSYVEMIDADQNGIDVRNGLKFTVVDENGETKSYSYDDDVWIWNDSLEIKVDGQIWKKSLESVANKKGSHELTLNYLGIEDTVVYEVIDFSDYTKDLETLKEGQTTLHVQDNVSKDYIFIPQNDSSYKISCNADYMSISIYQENGLLSNVSTYDKRTTELTVGKSYLFRACFNMYDVNTQKDMDVDITISRIPDISSIEVETPPKQIYIDPLDTKLHSVNLAENMKFRINYVDGTSEQIYFNEFIPMSYECDWNEQPGEIGDYVLKITSTNPYFEEKRYPISVISMEDAEERGLILPLDVEKKVDISGNSENESVYYKIGNISTGDYKIFLNSIDPTVDGQAELSLFSSTRFLGNIWASSQNDEHLLESLDGNTDYYIELKADNKEKEWNILITKKKVLEASIVKKTDKMSYYPFERPDLTGMEINIIYSNRDQEIIPYYSARWRAFFSDDITYKNGKWNVNVTDLSNTITYDSFECNSKLLSEYPDLILLENGTVRNVKLNKDNQYVIFLYTPSRTETYTFTSIGNEDTYGYLYDDSQECIMENDDGGDIRNLQLESQLTAGKIYYYVVRFCDTDKEGSFQVKLTGETVEHTHEFGEWVVTKEPTCTKAGEKTRTCTTCDASETETMNPLGHEYEETYTIDKEATKTEDGSKSRHCVRFAECGEKTDVTTVPATGDVYDQAEEIKEKDPDHLTENEKNKVNDLVSEMTNQGAESIQDNVDMATLAKLEELYLASNEAVEETAIDSDLKDVEAEGAALTVAKYLPESRDTAYKANITVKNETKITDNEELKDKVLKNNAYVLDISLSIVDSNGKTLSGAEEIQPAAPIRLTMSLPEEWKNTEFELYHYKNDGTSEQISYTFDENKQKIQFVVTSLSYYSFEKKQEEPCEHNWKEAPEKSKSPTCTKSGYTVFVCTKCEEEEQKEIKPLGHKYETKIDKQPTCETAGSKHEECIRCANKKPAVSIPATGHSFGEYKVTKQPTALTEGTETRTCANCGATESRAISKLKPIIALSATKLPLQLKKSTTVLKVTKMQTGDKVASFTSSNSKIVTVHKTNGKLTAKKVGKATITVKLKSGKSAKCIVNVQKTPVKTTKVQVTPSSLKLKKGKKAKLVTVLTPLTSQEKVTFTSSNKKIATVSSSGVVSAKKAGKAKITAKSGKKKVTCTVTVTTK